MKWTNPAGDPATVELIRCYAALSTAQQHMVIGRLPANARQQFAALVWEATTDTGNPPRYQFDEAVGLTVDAINSDEPDEANDLLASIRSSIPGPMSEYEVAALLRLLDCAADLINGE